MTERREYEESSSQVALYGFRSGSNGIFVTGEVFNRSSLAWSPRLLNNDLYLGAQVISQGGKIIKEARLPLPSEGVAPGKSCPFLFDISMEGFAAGSYIASIGIVRESKYWFHQRGGGVAQRKFEYIPGQESLFTEPITVLAAKPRRLIGLVLGSGGTLAKVVAEHLINSGHIEKTYVVGHSKTVRRINEILHSHAEHDLLFFHESLSAPDALWLDQLSQILNVSRRTGCVGGIVVSPSGRVIDAGGELTNSGFPHYWGCAPTDRRIDFGEPKEIGFISHRIALMNRYALQEVGDFSDVYSYFESAFIDWSYRAKMLGFRSVVVPNSRLCAEDTGIHYDLKSMRGGAHDRHQLIIAFDSAGVGVHVR